MASFVSSLKNSVMTRGTQDSVELEGPPQPKEKESSSTTSLVITKKKTLPPTHHNQQQQQQFLKQQQQNQQSQLQLQRDPVYLWSSLIAGVGSGALSSVICAPLDLIRTRLQVWSDLNMPAATLRQAFTEIFKKEGWQGYFRGLGASLATVPCFWGVYFPLYDDCKRHWIATYPTTNPSAVHCGSAVFAGAVSDLICNPMFVVRTRLQTEALHNLVEGTAQRGSSGIIRTIQSLYKEGGLPIFWRGMSANLMGLSHVGVQFPAYEYLKIALVKQRTMHLEKTRGHNNNLEYSTSVSSSLEPTALELFLASGLSKMTASLLTYPHEVIRSRMMDARGAAGTSLGTTIRRVYAQEGILGFYSGLPVALVRVIPNCCITFMTYELLLRFAKEEIRKHRQQQPQLPEK